MDDRRAALLLALSLAGAGVRLALAPAKAAAPGTCGSSPWTRRTRWLAPRAERRAARPALLPGERVDLDRADVTRSASPRIGPAFAQRVVDWREKHGRSAAWPGSIACRGGTEAPRELAILRDVFGVIRPRLDFPSPQLCYAVHFNELRTATAQLPPTSWVDPPTGGANHPGPAQKGAPRAEEHGMRLATPW